MSSVLLSLSDDALAAALAALAAAGRSPDWPSPADRAALSASTGWPDRHLAEAVRRAFAPFTPAACRRLVARGRASAAAHLVTRSPGTPPVAGVPATLPADPLAPPSLLVLLAGRAPAVAAAALFQGLAARRTVTLKPSSAEPLFAGLLCRLVASAAPALAPAASLLDAPSGDPRLAAALDAADAVLAYGSDATIAAVLAARPGRLTLAGGHRESAVVLFRDALDRPGAAPRLARAIARDAAVYDQSGCLSPQVVLVEEGAAVSPADLARHLALALVAAERDLPPGPVPLPDAAVARLFLEDSRLLARAGGGLVLPPSGPVPPAVVLLPGLPARPAPGFRVLQVVPFRGVPDLPALLPALAGRLQGLAVAGDRRRLAAALARAPAYRPCRLCAPGRLQSPPAGWPENGLDVVRALSVRPRADGVTRIDRPPETPQNRPVGQAGRRGRPG